MAFDCRGVEVVDFDPRVGTLLDHMTVTCSLLQAGFSVKGESSGKMFSDISLSDKVCLGYLGCRSNRKCTHYYVHLTHTHRSGMNTMTLLVVK